MKWPKWIYRFERIIEVDNPDKPTTFTAFGYKEVYFSGLYVRTNVLGEPKKD